MTRYKDEKGEYATALTYQFNISCVETENYTARENVRRIAEIIDSYFQEDRYICLDRIKGLIITQDLEDPNVLTGYIRYNCVLVSSENTIYRRY